MATHSSILAWRIPWTEEPGGLQTMGCAKSQTLQIITTQGMLRFFFQQVEARDAAKHCKMYMIPYSTKNYLPLNVNKATTEH